MISHADIIRVLERDLQAHRKFHYTKPLLLLFAVSLSLLAARQLGFEGAKVLPWSSPTGKLATIALFVFSGLSIFGILSLNTRWRYRLILFVAYLFLLVAGKRLLAELFGTVDVAHLDALPFGKHVGCYAIGLVLGLLVWVATLAVQKTGNENIRRFKINNHHLLRFSRTSCSSSLLPVPACGTPFDSSLGSCRDLHPARYAALATALAIDNRIMSTDGNIFYYRLASLYDSLSAAEFKLGRQLIQKGSLKAGDQVLEVGCGTGRLLVEIARRVLPGGTATGLDLSEPMLGIARKRIEKNKLTGNTKLIQGNALNLPFPDCSFEKVFSCFTLELFAEKDLARALSEMYRVLKPGGLVGIASLNAETPKEGQSDSTGGSTKNYRAWWIVGLSR